MATGGSIPAADEIAALSQSGRSVLEWLDARGASFFDDLVEGTRLLRPQVEDALAELAGLGLVTSDGFSGLRALLTPSDRRSPAGVSSGRRVRAAAGFGSMAGAGRWTHVIPGAGRSASGAASPPQNSLDEPGPRQRRDADVEIVARTLLRRYGVVFRRLLDQEGATPAWRDLLLVFRRLEARGDVRGGRFVEGFSGEQFAHPDAVAALRAVRRKPAEGQLVSISAADPLNLVGIVTPGHRVTALIANRILFRDGIPLAVRESGEVSFLATLDPEATWQAKNALLRRKVPPQLRFYLGRSA